MRTKQPATKACPYCGEQSIEPHTTEECQALSGKRRVRGYDFEDISDAESFLTLAHVALGRTVEAQFVSARDILVFITDAEQRVLDPIYAQGTFVQGNFYFQAAVTAARTLRNNNSVILA